MSAHTIRRTSPPGHIADLREVSWAAMADIRSFVRWLPARLGYGVWPRVLSWLRRRWVLLRHPHGEIRFGRGVYLGPVSSLHIPTACAFSMGDGGEFGLDFR